MLNLKRPKYWNYSFIKSIVVLQLLVLLIINGASLFDPSSKDNASFFLNEVYVREMFK